MDNGSHDRELIAKFGRAIAKVHERQVEGVRLALRKIFDPHSEHDHAFAAYFGGMDRDRLILAQAQRAIEGTLHDLFFLFEDSEEYKLVLKRQDGSEIDLAQAVDVIQAFPMEWYEKASSAGDEGARLMEVLTEELNLGKYMPRAERDD